MSKVLATVESTFNHLKPGVRVMDSWYNDLGVGTVTKVFSKTVHISWTHKRPYRDFEIYDKEHADTFLNILPKERKNVNHKKP